MIFYVTAIALLAIDQASKWLVVHHLENGPIVGDVIRVTVTENSGAAFGLFQGARTAFLLVSVVATVGLIWAHRVLGASERARRLSLAAILGGNLGNFVDRLRTGRVTDFIDMGIGDARWPVYNVADVAVVAGALMLGWLLVQESQHERRGVAQPAQASENAASSGSSDLD